MTDPTFLTGMNAQTSQIEMTKIIRTTKMTKMTRMTKAIKMTRTTEMEAFKETGRDTLKRDRSSTL